MNRHVTLLGLKACHMLSHCQIPNRIQTKRIEFPLHTNDDDTTIILNISICTRPATLLIDSGSSISLINGKCLKKGTKINRAKKFALTSATGHSADTIASTVATIATEDDTFHHEFNIFGNNIPLKYDGILGYDFLLKFKSYLDIENKKLSIQIFKPNANVVTNHNTFPHKQYETEVTANAPFANSMLSAYINKTKAESNYNYIPERSVKQITLLAPVNDGIYNINRKIFLPNVEILNSLVEVNKNKTNVFISNKNNFPVNHIAVSLSTTDFERTTKFFLIKTQPGCINMRQNIIVTALELNHCTSYEKKAILELCKTYEDCFFIDGDKITHTDIIEHSIALKKDAKPVFVRQYRLPESQRLIITKELDKMERQGIIEKCHASGWNSPIILVPKRDENGEKTNHRLVVDFRRLNDVTVPIQFPIPQIDSIIDRLAHSVYFSTLDTALFIK